MPVYENVYRVWEGKRRLAIFRWLAIPKFAYLEAFERRVITGFFTLAWMQFLIRLVYIYIQSNEDFLKLFPVPMQSVLPINAYFFKNMIDWQLPFCFIFAFLIGSGLIARDVQHRAVILYFSKPISRFEYFIGKFAVLFFLFMLITFFQVLLLFMVHTAVSPATSLWRINFRHDYAWIPSAAAAYCLVVTVTINLLIMACSSLARNARYAGLTFSGVIIGASIGAGVIAEQLENPAWLAISPFKAVVDLGYYLFRLPTRSALNVGAAWAGVLVTWALCAIVIQWSLRRATRSVN